MKRRLPNSTLSVDTKKGLRRKAALKRNTRMRRESAKKAKERRDTDKLRKAGRTDESGDAKPCVLCPFVRPGQKPNDSEHTHEITRGTASRSKAVYEPLVQMGVCPQCHDRLDDYNKWPIEKQIAAQWLCVLAAVIRIRGRAPTSIQTSDVLPYLSSLADS